MPAKSQKTQFILISIILLTSFPLLIFLSTPRNGRQKKLKQIHNILFYIVYYMMYKHIYVYIFKTLH